MTDSDVRPLPIAFGRPPSESDWEALRAAKRASGVDVLVQFVKAVPGGTGRVVAIDTKPPYVTDYWRVSIDSPELPEAIAWSLGREANPRAVTASDMLSDMLGCWVTELEPEQGQQTVRFQ